MWDLVKAFAAWAGWFPIAFGAIVVLLVGKYFYEKELSVRDQRIGQLKDEIENGKAYQYDEIYKRLAERVRVLHQEMNLLKSETDSKQAKIEIVSQELTAAHAEIRELQIKLRSFDDQLEELLEPDYCEVCEPDDDHQLTNFIWWGASMYSLIGDENLVENLGYCDYCTSPQVKCKVCGAITSLDNNSSDEWECNGGCGVVYQVISYVEDHSTQYAVKVSRMEEVE